MDRHECEIKLRKASNHKKDRAKIDEDSLKDYHGHLSKTMEGVPGPANVANFDETNFT